MGGTHLLFPSHQLIELVPAVVPAPYLGQTSRPPTRTTHSPLHYIVGMRPGLQVAKVTVGYSAPTTARWLFASSDGMPGNT